MAVAYDATATAGGGGTSWTHTPVGAPRGVVVCISAANAAITDVTYGGVSMTPTASSPLAAAGEAIPQRAYTLHSSVPTGAQTVACTGSGLTSVVAASYTVTADDDTEVVDEATISSTAVENPSGTLSLAGRTCFCVETWASGQDATTGVSPLSNWNSDIEVDAGTFTIGHYRYTIVGSTDVTFGATQTTEDFNCIGVAIAEVQSGLRAGTLGLLGVGR